MRIVEVLTNADRTRRVEIFERDNGTFGFRDWAWDAEEQAWVPGGSYAECRTDSAERAKAEARGRVAWLSTDA